MPLETSDLRVTVEQVEGAVLLRAAGEIDLSTSPTLATAVDEACTGAETDLRMDLTEVTFIDSTGLREVIGAKTRVAERGRRFSIVGASRVVQRLLDVTGLTDFLG
ncbi:MAG: STAS domain-containing protein [Microthrixaceae bacterium]